MKVYIVRHGEKAAGVYNNPALNNPDEPLSAYGLRQAKALAEYFHGTDIKAVYVSQYIRTAETARFTAEDKGLPLIKDGRLNEIYSGDTGGITEKEFEDKLKEFRDEYVKRNIAPCFLGGESGADVLKRQESFLSCLKERNENALLVTHDGFIRIWMCSILGLTPYDRYKLKTSFCGISLFEYEPDYGEWKVLMYNMTLDPMKK